MRRNAVSKIADDCFDSADSIYGRNDTVVAESDCCVVAVDAMQLDKILCWSQASTYIDMDIDSQLNLSEDADWMKTILHSNLFYKASPLHFQRLFDRLMPCRCRTWSR